MSREKESETPNLMILEVNGGLNLGNKNLCDRFFHFERKELVTSRTHDQEGGGDYFFFLWRSF